MARSCCSMARTCTTTLPWATTSNRSTPDLDLGVDNVFDKQPPLLFANNSQNANTDPNDFDVMGRYYWARVTVNF